MLLASWGEPEVQQLVHCITQTVYSAQYMEFMLYDKWLPHVYLLKININSNLQYSPVPSFVSAALPYPSTNNLQQRDFQ